MKQFSSPDVKKLVLRYNILDPVCTASAQEKMFNIRQNLLIPRVSMLQVQICITEALYMKLLIFNATKILGNFGMVVGHG